MELLICKKYSRDAHKYKKRTSNDLPDSQRLRVHWERVSDIPFYDKALINLVYTAKPF